MGTGLTRTFSSAPLRASLEVPVDWRDGELVELTGHLEQTIVGSAGAGALVQHMPAPDPDADVRRWALAPLQLTGVPAVTLALCDGVPPSLERWEEIGDVAARLGADEAWLYTGDTDDGNEVGVLVVRWGPYAWQIGVAAPGEDIAGPIFASLDLG